jgi:hypothetical protein
MSPPLQADVTFMGSEHSRTESLGAGAGARWGGQRGAARQPARRFACWERAWGRKARAATACCASMRALRGMLTQAGGSLVGHHDVALVGVRLRQADVGLRRHHVPHDDGGRRARGAAGGGRRAGAGGDGGERGVGAPPGADLGGGGRARVRGGFSEGGAREAAVQRCMQDAAAPPQVPPSAPPHPLAAAAAGQAPWAAAGRAVRWPGRRQTRGTAWARGCTWWRGGGWRERGGGGELVGSLPRQGGLPNQGLGAWGAQRAPTPPSYLTKLRRPPLRMPM